MATGNHVMETSVAKPDNADDKKSNITGKAKRLTPAMKIRRFSSRASLSIHNNNLLLDDDVLN
jgi:hypothetical protein